MHYPHPGQGLLATLEWAIAQDRIYLLQSRPITALANRADPDGAAYLWDNSNIAESYSGITTPLTFSFARRAYATDNPLIAYPLAYQYLTSLRADALPVNADELLSMRGRGDSQ